MANYSASMADFHTSPVMKRTFFLLLQGEGVNREEILRDFRVDLSGSSEADRRVIRKASDKMRDLVNAADGLSVADNLRDFEQRRWSVTSANVHGEFLKVTKELFGDNANWGRVIGLAGFAVAYAIYVERLGIHGVIPSVCEWTVDVFTERLGKFLQDSGGWVSMHVMRVLHSVDPHPST